ncbi:glycosyl hydrolase family 28-related protein [Arthrobacter sp. MI7-26]|uniref:glycosyl hydrolase family 28-related protein n=1 Tax=Arthrobacter sp. MI7-26 TaxID=2993653 RepID=UPI00224962C2|nr:glycosyl hydrolase family 28-related protein [Arthrobacter sp. MI7-26]MCX2747041.1 glycosyl hydrolase family 28-related protein [Arthrobacter sp. MI7-26]
MPGAQNATYPAVKTVSPSYGNGVHDATAHIQSIIDAANTEDVEVYVPAGTYKITATLEGLQRMRLAEGAKITAGAAMTAVIRTSIGTRLDRGYIGGKGVIDANTNAEIGLHIRDFLYFEARGLSVTGGKLAAIKLGDAGSSGRSAEAVISGVRLFSNAPTVIAGGCGILVENSGDHSFSQIIIQNYETGVTLPVGGNAVVHDVHAWADPAKGAMKVGFEDHSNGSHYNSCHADSPTQYGWHIYGYNVTLVQCGTYLNPGVTQIADNTVVGIRFESAYSVAVIVGHFFNGASESLRMNSDIQAVDAIYGSVTYIGCTQSNVVHMLTNRNRLVDIVMDANVGAQIGTNPAQKLGFYGATPTVRPALTYSRATENAAQAQIRTTLVGLGLVTDSTVA